MKPEQLYGILGIKPYIEPIRPKVDYIISNDASQLFRLAAYSVQQNHTSRFGISYSDQLLTEYSNGETFKYVYFKTPNSLESLRGSVVDIAYIETDINIEVLRPYLPNFKNIIYIDKQAKEE
jgi:hypothetical protein